MGPLSYLHNDLPKISGVWILPYCIGDREVTENAGGALVVTTLRPIHWIDSDK